MVHWGNSPGSHNVFFEAKNAIHILAGVPGQTSCKQRLIGFKILTVSCLFIYSNVAYVKENISLFGCGVLEAHIKLGFHIS